MADSKQKYRGDIDIASVYLAVILFPKPLDQISFNGIFVVTCLHIVPNISRTD